MMTQMMIDKAQTMMDKAQIMMTAQLMIETQKNAEIGQNSSLHSVSTHGLSWV